MMQSKGLYKPLLGTEEQPKEPAPLANWASNDEKKNHKVLKDAYEKQVADIKERRNNLWCYLALTLDATTLMLMRHDCVGDDSIGDGAKPWKLLQERSQSVETSTVLNLFAQLARLQLEDAEDLNSFFIRGQELLTRQQEAGEAVSENLFNILVLNGLSMRYETFVIQESFKPATNFTELRKRLQFNDFNESTTQRHKGQSGSVALAVKLDLKKGPKKENCVISEGSLCVGSLDTLPKTAGGWRQHNAASIVRKVTKTEHARDMEANMSQWQLVQHWLHQTKYTGQLLPSGRRQAC